MPSSSTTYLKLDGTPGIGDVAIPMEQPVSFRESSEAAAPAESSAEGSQQVFNQPSSERSERGRYGASKGRPVPSGEFTDPVKYIGRGYSRGASRGRTPEESYHHPSPAALSLWHPRGPPTLVGPKADGGGAAAESGLPPRSPYTLHLVEDSSGPVRREGWPDNNTFTYRSTKARQKLNAKAPIMPRGEKKGRPGQGHGYMKFTKAEEAAAAAAAAAAAEAARLGGAAAGEREQFPEARHSLGSPGAAGPKGGTPLRGVSSEGSRGGEGFGGLADQFARTTRTPVLGATRPAHNEMRASDEALKKSLEYQDGRLWRTPVLGTRAAADNARRAQLSTPVGIQHAYLQPLDKDLSHGMVSKMVMEHWLQGLKDGKGGYMSSAIYLQEKLEEGLRVTDGALPSHLRTSMCCVIFNMLTQNMGYYRSTLNILKKELFRSIFYDPQAILDQCGADPVPGGPTEQVYTELFLNARPYFQKITQLQARVAELDVENKKLKRDMEYENAVHISNARFLRKQIIAWRGQLVESMFNQWREGVAQAQAARKAISRVVEKLVQKGPSLKTVFEDWKLLVRDQRYDKTKEASVRAQYVERSLKLREAQLASAKSEIDQLKEENKIMRAQLSQLEAYKDDESSEKVEELTEEMQKLQKKMVGAERVALYSTHICSWLAEACIQAPMPNMDELYTLLPYAGKLCELSEDCRDEMADVFAEEEAAAKVARQEARRKKKNSKIAHSLNEEEDNKPDDPSRLIWTQFPHLLETADQELEKLDTEQVLMRWANVRSGPARPVMNFGDDLKDVNVFATIVNQLVSNGPEVGKGCFDPGKRWDACCDALRGMEPPVTNTIVNLQSILSLEEDKNAAFMSLLFSACNDPEVDFKDKSPLGKKISESLEWCNENLFKSRRGLDRLLEVMHVCKRAVQAGLGPESLPDLEQEMIKAREAVDQIKLSTSTLYQGAVWVRKAYVGWQRLRLRAVGYGWTVLHGRLQGNEPVKPPNERLEIMYNTYSFLSPHRMKDLLKKEGDKADLAQLQVVLHEYCDLNKQIFTHYAAGASGHSTLTLSSFEFRMLMRDCKLTDTPKKDANLSSGVLDMIFQKVLKNAQALQDLEDLAGKPRADGGKSTQDANPRRPGQLANILNKVVEEQKVELSPEDFPELLVRVASAKYKDDEMLHVKLKKLISGPIETYAARCDTADFRGRLNTDQVQAVFRRYGTSLERIFEKYAAGDGVIGADTISIGEFKALVADCKLLTDSMLTESALASMFAHAQDTTSFDDGEEMNYIEFLEVLGSLTNYKICNPYQPFEHRIDQFIRTNILPFAKQTKPSLSALSSSKDGGAEGTEPKKTRSASRKAVSGTGKGMEDFKAKIKLSQAARAIGSGVSSAAERTRASIMELGDEDRPNSVASSISQNEGSRPDTAGE